jgi:hypothetical protein
MYWYAAFSLVLLAAYAGASAKGHENALKCHTAGNGCAKMVYKLGVRTCMQGMPAVAMHEIAGHMKSCASCCRVCRGSACKSSKGSSLCAWQLCAGP